MTVASMTHKTLYLLTRPPLAPARQVIGYYALLAATLIGFRWFVPGAMGFLGVGRLPALATESPQLLPDPAGAFPGSPSSPWSAELGLAFALVGTLVLMLPVSWVYMSVRREMGFQKSVVQALLVLPLAVASVIVAVQHSLALAFGLGAVVAAVRFRNTLKEISDAIYLFVAIAIGLGVGVGAFVSAGIVSLVFSLVELGLWRCGYGECARPGIADAPPWRTRDKDIVRTVGAAPLPAEEQHRRKEKGKGTRMECQHLHAGVLTARTRTPDLAQRKLERVLERNAIWWRREDVMEASDGTTCIRYLAHLNTATPVEALVQSLAKRRAFLTVEWS